MPHECLLCFRHLREDRLWPLLQELLVAYYNHGVAVRSDMMDLRLKDLHDAHAASMQTV